MLKSVFTAIVLCSAVAFAPVAMAKDEMAAGKEMHHHHHHHHHMHKHMHHHHHMMQKKMEEPKT